MTIPRYRVMNWWENGVREPDPEGRRCHVRVQEANTDGTDAQDVQRAYGHADLVALAEVDALYADQGMTQEGIHA